MDGIFQFEKYKTTMYAPILLQMKLNELSEIQTESFISAVDVVS